LWPFSFRRFSEGFAFVRFFFGFGPGLTSACLIILRFFGRFPAAFFGFRAFTVAGFLDVTFLPAFVLVAFRGLFFVVTTSSLKIYH
jgi:hypothetical protein